jgi:hypothetical protein
MALAHSCSADIDLGSEDSRKALAKMVIKLFQLWELPTADQLDLLGLSPNSRAMLGRYARGEALPGNRDVMDRVGWLLAIHKALRLLYPYDEAVRRTWVTRRNTAFDNLTPLMVMKEQGLLGLARVARYLDYYRGR